MENNEGQKDLCGISSELLDGTVQQVGHQMDLEETPPSFSFKIKN